MAEASEPEPQPQHSRVALITGITGQDGSYLTELLLSKNYHVIGIVRRNSMLYNTARIDHIRKQVSLIYGDMTDGSSLASALTSALASTAPDGRLEIYNLAAQSHVAVSYEVPEYTMEVNALGVLKLLEAIRRLSPADQQRVRLYQAGTSEMFGDTAVRPQNELTPFQPVSPYAAAKVYAHQLVTMYRTAYGMYLVNGILFNHESPRRGANFVTMKTIGVVKRHREARDRGDPPPPPLELGNLNSLRDWGYAKEYVEGMWRMLQEEEPDDYVLATGQTHTVRAFVTEAFRQAGFELEWSGEGLGERAVDQDGVERVRVAARYFRPTEVPYLLGDATKARERLGWTPATTTLEEMVRVMLVV